MSQQLQTIITSTLEVEFRAFLEQLQKCPAEQFGAQLGPGHSVAWHALHVMDWTRCVIQPSLQGINPALTYGYLGFEEKAWAQAAYGPTLAGEQDGKEKILAALQSVFAGAVTAVRIAPAERFSTAAQWTTLKKPRPVLDGLMYHIRHTAYHRGQVQQVIAAQQLMPEAVA